MAQRLCVARHEGIPRDGLPLWILTTTSEEPIKAALSDVMPAGGTEWRTARNAKVNMRRTLGACARGKSRSATPLANFFVANFRGKQHQKSHSPISPMHFRGDEGLQKPMLPGPPHRTFSALAHYVSQPIVLRELKGAPRRYCWPSALARSRRRSSGGPVTLVACGGRSHGWPRAVLVTACCTATDSTLHLRRVHPEAASWRRSVSLFL